MALCRVYAAAVGRRIVVAGITGSGKSTIGRVVADRLGATFVDGDELHPPANVAKMAGGAPLTDADREPWLESVRSTLAGHESIVIACSALRCRYRDVLRSVPDVSIVLLYLDPDLGRRRTELRTGHFMRSSMVGSQFETLELPLTTESGVTVITATDPIDVVVERVFSAVLGDGSAAERER